MTLHDARIKKLIRDWTSGAEEAWQPLRREVEIYVYQFPRLAYRKDRDICSDFFLYTLDRLPSVFRNFPMEAGIQFKTFLNASLKNLFFQFMRYQKKAEIRTVTLEDQEIPVETFSEEVVETTLLSSGLDQLSPKERMLLRYFYFPDSITAEDIRESAVMFGRSASELAEIRQGLMEARWTEIKRIRTLSEEIGVVNKKLVDMKRHLLKLEHNGCNLSEAFELTDKIARMDSRRWKLVRMLDAPEKLVLQVFTSLFDHDRKAGRELEKARQRLRFEILRLQRMQREA